MNNLCAVDLASGAGYWTVSLQHIPCHCPPSHTSSHQLLDVSKRSRPAGAWCIAFSRVHTEQDDTETMVSGDMDYSWVDEGKRVFILNIDFIESLEVNVETYLQ